MRNLRRLHISPRIFNRPIRSAGKRSSRTEKPTESVPEQKYTLSENQKYCFQTFATTAVAVAVIWLESVKFCFFIWSGRFLVLFRTHFYCEFFLLALTRQFRWFVRRSRTILFLNWLRFSFLQIKHKFNFDAFWDSIMVKPGQIPAPSIASSSDTATSREP